jgi:hypothetical protein
MVYENQLDHELNFHHHFGCVPQSHVYVSLFMTEDYEYGFDIYPIYETSDNLPYLDGSRRTPDSLPPSPTPEEATTVMEFPLQIPPHVFPTPAMHTIEHRIRNLSLYPSILISNTQHNPSLYPIYQNQFEELYISCMYDEDEGNEVTGSTRDAFQCAMQRRLDERRIAEEEYMSPTDSETTPIQVRFQSAVVTIQMPIEYDISNPVSITVPIVRTPGRARGRGRAPRHSDLSTNEVR